MFAHRPAFQRLDDLSGPVAVEADSNLSKDETRARISAFIQSRALPEHLDGEFAQALREALSGLHKVTIKISDPPQALKVADGRPSRRRLKNALEILSIDRLEADARSRCGQGTA
ncbi:MAG: DUF6079 family protein [Deltaproteobacteria bacterium]|nr:DUF6079 family protein [Deltaproteobacteria bacterium]